MSARWKLHAVTDLFPPMNDAEFAALVADIRTYGQREPITLLGNMVIDGRHRLRACEELGIEPKAQRWIGKEAEVMAYVVSVNLHRRHLNESQRTEIADRMATLPKGTNQHAQVCAPSQSEAATLMNVSRRGVQKVRDIRERAPELIEKIRSGEMTVSAAERDLRRADRVGKLTRISAEDVPLSPMGRRFPVIVADPPWQYEPGSTDDTRIIENQYPTMTLGDICAMGVGDVVTDDAVLFLWATSPKLEEAFEVVRAWGFTYRTCAVWHKPQIGMGYYFRQQHELLLVATVGSIPVPVPSARVGSVVTHDRMAHSVKPEVFRDIIDAMYPELPKLELFARSGRAGWTAWGNQTGERVA